jgi:hypothetical protein
VSRALRTVARLRKLAIDEARGELAARLAAEARAAEADRAAQEAMRRERQAALALGAEDTAFATWLPRGLHARDLARDAATRAQEATHQGRAALVAARAAAEAVNQMLAAHAAERLADANRREQAVLDEVGQRRAVRG